MIGSLVARSLGLSVPLPALIDVRELLVEASPELTIHDRNLDCDRCTTGLQIGSRFVGSRIPRHVVDYLEASSLRQLKNAEEFAGMLAFDKWTGNCDGRQAVFERPTRRKSYRAVFIDHGYCFNAEKWSFPDNLLSGIFAQRDVYATVIGWKSFEPWLSLIEEYPEDALYEAVAQVPPLWFDEEYDLVECLMDTLLRSKKGVRELIGQFRDCGKELFQNWKSARKVVVIGLAAEANDGSPQCTYYDDSGTTLEP